MTASGGLKPVRAWACLGLLLGAPWLLRAGQPAPQTVEPADEDLIEFLGSVDSDDVEWKEYLVRKDTQRGRGEEAIGGGRRPAARPGRMRRKMNIRRGLLGVLLTGVLSVGAYLPVCAQASLHRPARRSPGAATVPWNSLSADQQRLLSRVSGQWDQLTPQRQQALASGSQRWVGMSQDQRTEARQRFINGNSLPQQRREQLRQRWEDFRSQPPARQQAQRENFRKFQQLPQQRRQQLRQRWQSATPAQRQNMVQRARAPRVERAPKRR
ncbi:MAG: DUF3106 domain-containing protein [Steroidobacteraceae bacterium]